jgi:hypothetical protein
MGKRRDFIKKAAAGSRIQSGKCIPFGAKYNNIQGANEDTLQQ